MITRRLFISALSCTVLFGASSQNILAQPMQDEEYHKFIEQLYKLGIDKKYDEILNLVDSLNATSKEKADILIQFLRTQHKVDIDDNIINKVNSLLDDHLDNMDKNNPNDVFELVTSYDQLWRAGFACNELTISLDSLDVINDKLLPLAKTDKNLYYSIAINLIAHYAAIPEIKVRMNEQHNVDKVITASERSLISGTHVLANAFPYNKNGNSIEVKRYENIITYNEARVNSYNWYTNQYFNLARFADKHGKDTNEMIATYKASTKELLTEALSINPNSLPLSKYNDFLIQIVYPTAWIYGSNYVIENIINNIDGKSISEKIKYKQKDIAYNVLERYINTYESEKSAKDFTEKYGNQYDFVPDKTLAPYHMQL